MEWENIPHPDYRLALFFYYKILAYTFLKPLVLLVAQCQDIYRRERWPFPFIEYVHVYDDLSALIRCRLRGHDPVARDSGE